MKKVITAITLLSILIVMLQSNSVYAMENYTSVETIQNPLLKNVGRIVETKNIQIDGQSNKLYFEFSDGNKAILDIKEKVPNLLSVLSTKFDLSELCSTNWKDYENAMFNLLNTKDSNTYDESNMEIRRLRAFFDIYENSEKNSEIIALSKSNFEGSRTKLAELLPSTEPFVKKYINSVNIQSRASFNVANAINYANTYATNPNTPTYYYFSNGDCANFVSQILENSGVSQVVYSSTIYGWWHKRETGFLGIGYTHTHSQSWSLAKNFALYQGVKYSTTSNYNFSANLSNGSFIVADFTNDGDWDHCGFVTQRDTYIGSSYGYYDYKVAQHTSNYHGWASLSANNWENIGADGGKYGRVRT